MRDYNPTIDVSRVEFNRNGICGQPFWSVSFTDPRNAKLQFTAIVTDELCAVVTAADLTANWRGDFYEAPLRRAIAAQGYADDTQACPGCGMPNDAKDPDEVCNECSIGRAEYIGRD